MTEKLRLGVADVRALPLAAASVDAIVCDPPYEFGFMGKRWDASGVAFQCATWAEALRVLKPGGHLVAFGGSRTWHRLTCAIEDAGFEIRDCLMWLYGSGFPKSLDVSKAIDRVNGDALAWREFSAAYAVAVAESHYNHAEIDRVLGIKASSSYWARQDHRGGMPPRHHWERVRDLLGLPVEFERLYAEAEREVLSERPAYGIGGNAAFNGHSDGAIAQVTAPSTDAARHWEGWGTALKPAFEPIVLARKPLQGTVAQNVLAHGTGALNIDGARIAHVSAEDLATSLAKNPGRSDFVTSGVYGSDRPQQRVNTDGRWPANVLLDEEAAALLDLQTGESTDGVAVNRNRAPETMTSWLGTRASPVGEDVGYGGSGGASRFFYTAKASRSEREAGLEAFAPVRRSDGREKDIENPRLRTNERRNHHPTVKPVDLMRWLVRLVTPPNGIVLDPFLGSGSTGMAALDEGMRFVGFDLDPEYVALARQRIAHRHVLEGRLLAAGEGTEQLVLL